MRTMRCGNKSVTDVFKHIQNGVARNASSPRAGVPRGNLVREGMGLAAAARRVFR